MEAGIGNSNDRRTLRSEKASESINEPTEVVFFADGLRTDEELFMKAKKEIFSAKSSKDVVFTGVEPIRGCRVADSLIEQNDIESLAARYKLVKCILPERNSLLIICLAFHTTQYHRPSGPALCPRRFMIRIRDGLR